MAGEQEQAKTITHASALLRPERPPLFVLEGIDLSGRTTQVHLLNDWLTAQHYAVTRTALRDSPLIADVLARARAGTSLQPLTYSLLFAADHIDRTQRVIQPTVARAEIVLADRYIYTAFARDVARGLDIGWIENLYRYAVQPAIVFYLHISPEEAVQRRMTLLQQRVQDMRHAEARRRKHGHSDTPGKPDKAQKRDKKPGKVGKAPGVPSPSVQAPVLSQDALDSFRNFEAKMYREYERMRQAYAFTVIEGSQSIEQVQAELRRAMLPLLLERSALH